MSVLDDTEKNMFGKDGEKVTQPNRWRNFAKKWKDDKIDKKITTRDKWIAVGKVILLTMWTLLALFAIEYVLAYILVRIFGAEVMQQTLWSTIYSGCFYCLAFVALLFVTPKLLDLWDIIRKRNKKQKLVRHKIANRKELGLTGLPTWTDLALAPVGLVVALILGALGTAIFQIFSWFDAEQAQELLFSNYVVGFDRMLVFLVLVVVAPLAEELIFRGWLYGKMREILHGKLSIRLAITLAIFATSLAFAVMHGQWNVGVVVFMMSIVMCGLREITGTIYAGTILHMLKNAIAFFALFMM